MKIYILCDMEGLSGIRRMEEVKSEYPGAYEAGRLLMMQDINACVAGAFEGGATEIIVCDTHGGGGQLWVDRLDVRVQSEIPNCGRLMPSLDESFAGVILLGHHAQAGTINGFLDHTMNSAEWFEYRLNDRIMGEIGIEAAWAGHYNVPVIMVSGDETTANEAKDTLGDVECAIVKWGIGRNKARCLPLSTAHQIVRETAASAVSRALEISSFQIDLPATVQLTFYRSDMCERFASRPDTERVNARTIRRTISSALDVCTWVS